MDVIVTGGAGFIGSNIARALVSRPDVDRVIVADDLGLGGDYRNMMGVNSGDLRKLHDLGDAIASLGPGDVVIHQAGCVDTTNHDAEFMMQSNYYLTKLVLDVAQKSQVRVIYASSAATYGNRRQSVEDSEDLHPINVYGFSKLLTDRYAQSLLDGASTQIVGLRYFNVYGPGEAHKGRMASVVWHFTRSYLEKGFIEVFGDYGGYAAGEHRRDFVWVGDVVNVINWLLDNEHVSGCLNVGTGHATSFNQVALACVNAVQRRANGQPMDLSQAVNLGAIRYIPFPSDLSGKYQCETQADLTKLRDSGFSGSWTPIEIGVAQYVEALMAGPLGASHVGSRDD